MIGLFPSTIKLKIVHEVQLSISKDYFFQVAQEMQNLGFSAEAEFCWSMSQYVKACDDRGLDPEARIYMMMPLFRFILDRVMVPCFPLHGTNTVSGLNYHLAEEILTSVQARLYLYIMTPDTGNHLYLQQVII